jgi:hypothetical protein
MLKLVMISKLEAAGTDEQCKRYGFPKENLTTKGSFLQMYC